MPYTKYSHIRHSLHLVTYVKITHFSDLIVLWYSLPFTTTACFGSTLAEISPDCVLNTPFFASAISNKWASGWPGHTCNFSSKLMAETRVSESCGISGSDRRHWHVLFATSLPRMLSVHSKFMDTYREWVIDMPRDKRVDERRVCKSQDCCL